MFSTSNILTVTALCLATSLLVQTAPTDTTTTSAPASPTTTIASDQSSSTAANQTGPITTIVPEDAPSSSTMPTQSASAPSTDAQMMKDATFPMAPEHHQQVSTNFTCYGRNLGYYADMQQGCSVYHFCLLGEYSGQSVYQRITYRCLNNTNFDQQALDCVEPSAMSAPCAESESFYESSNVVLRQAVVEANSPQQGLQPVAGGNSTTSPVATTTTTGPSA